MTNNYGLLKVLKIIYLVFGIIYFSMSALALLLALIVWKNVFGFIIGFILNLVLFSLWSYLMKAVKRKLNK